MFWHDVRNKNCILVQQFSYLFGPYVFFMSPMGVVFVPIQACANSDMFYPLILVVWRLFLWGPRWRWKVFQHSFYYNNCAPSTGCRWNHTVRTIWRARFRRLFFSFGRRSEYAAFCIISATVVRETTMSVAFGTLAFSVTKASGGGPLVAQIFRVAQKFGFRRKATSTLLLWKHLLLFFWRGFTCLW